MEGTARMPPTAIGPAPTPALDFTGWLKQYGLDPRKLDPHYDYRGAFKAGVGPGIDPHETEIDPTTGAPYLHWDSRFKMDTHPHRFIPSELGIYDSKYNKVLPQEEFIKRATPDQLSSVKNEKYTLPKAEVEGYLGSK